MMRALTFRSVNDLATWMNENGMGLESILTHNSNSSGWIDILYNSASGSGSPAAFAYSSGSGTGVDSGAITISVNSGAKTFTRSAGSYITDGFKVGDHVTFSGNANAGNNSTFVVTTLTALVMTCAAATGLVTEAGTGDEVATLAGHTVTVPSGARAYEISATGAGGAGTLSIDGGDDIDIPASGGFEVDLEGRKAGPFDVVTSANLDYYVSWVV